MSDEDCRDIYGYDTHQRQQQVQLPPNASVAQRDDAQRRIDIEKERSRQAQVLYLQLLASAGTLVTEVTAPISGDNIETDYTELYRNGTSNPVRVQVFADLTTPGCGAVLSLTRDRSDVGKYDVLALVANGHVESVSTIVLPTYSIWARDLNPGFFPMAAVDTLRIRLFDPMKLITYGNLFTSGR